jgi:hypothetical protein
MTNFPEKIALALMDSIMAAFRTEAADLRRLAEEVDAAGRTSRRYARPSSAMPTRERRQWRRSVPRSRPRWRSSNASWAFGNGRCTASLAQA